MPMANHFPFDVISTLKGTQKQVEIEISDGILLTKWVGMLHPHHK